MQLIPNSNKLGFMWRYNLEEHTCSCKNYKQVIATGIAGLKLLLAQFCTNREQKQPTLSLEILPGADLADTDTPVGQSTQINTQEPKSVHLLLFLTMSGPQVVPSAAGMNLVSHRCPTRWHQSDLQMSCQTNQTNEKVVYNQCVSPPLDADTQGVLNRTTQSMRQNRSNSVKGGPPVPSFPAWAHSSTTHWLGPADERNADVVFDLVLGKHGRHLEEL